MTERKMYRPSVRVIGLVLYISWFLYCSVHCQLFGGDQPEIVFRYVEVCPEPLKYGWNYSMKTSKISKKQFKFDFIAYAKEPYDENFKARVEVWIWTNAGWKSNFYNFFFRNVCQIMKDKMPKVFKKVVSATNRTAKCPIEPGLVILKDMLIDFDDYNIPSSILRVGRFKVKLYFMYKKRDVMCLDWYTDVVPTQKRSKAG